VDTYQILKQVQDLKNLKQNIFYQDIKIEQKKCKSFNEYNFDIKTPWEESRFQHLFLWGYKKIAPSPPFALRNIRACPEPVEGSRRAKNQINNWIDQNPYLLGVNWVCPMEVAIRAINWIYGFYFFKDSKNIPLAFWQKFVCSLYDHAKYLENNWETSDKPNNHYLSDLIGYFYLCFFFDDLNHFKKQKQKTYIKILQQFNHQVQADGTCYEGSTNYHKLVTEIFLHFYQLQKMIQFLQNCSDQKGNLVQIGDNDSGKILMGIKPFETSLRSSSGRTGEEEKLSNKTNNSHFTLNIFPLLSQREDKLNLNKFLSYFPFALRNEHIVRVSRRVFNYPNFGLSIIKNKNWHITFRHPTYNKKQPTGHFHQDELSITLSIDGIPVLIDPGTYVYTANTKWRNLMRSKKMHNTFCLQNKGIENLESLDLFQFSKKEQNDKSQIKQNNELIEIKNFYEKQFRKLTFYQNKNILKIEDWVETSPREFCCWNLIFHPKINLEKEKNDWIIYHQTSKILRFKSDLEFQGKKSFYSPGYGKIERCIKFFAKQKVEHLKKIVLLFQKI